MSIILIPKQDIYMDDDPNELAFIAGKEYTTVLAPSESPGIYHTHSECSEEHWIDAEFLIEFTIKDQSNGTQQVSTTNP